MMASNSGVADSRYTRTIVANALSTENPFESSSFKGATHSCSIDNGTHFYAKQILGDLQNNIWEFDFTWIKGHRIYSKKTAEIAIPRVSPLGDFSIPGSPQIDPEAMIIFGTRTKSKINPNEMITLVANATS